MPAVVSVGPIELPVVVMGVVAKLSDWLASPLRSVVIPRRPTLVNRHCSAANAVLHPQVMGMFGRTVGLAKPPDSGQVDFRDRRSVAGHVKQSRRAKGAVALPIYLSHSARRDRCV